MKDFIVIAAILPLLLIFMLQFANDCRNSEQIEIIQNVMYVAKEEAKREGYFSESLKEEITSQISDKLRIPRENISFWASEDRKMRYEEDNIIKYKLSVRLKDVMAGADMMGISAEENSYDYVIDSFTSSEYLGDF